MQAKKCFRASRSIQKMSANLQKMWDIEKQLAEDYTAISTMEEDEAILRIKSNSKAFFAFARSRQKVKSKVGPFLDPTTNMPNSSPDFTAEELKRQYDSVFAAPRPDWSVILRWRMVMTPFMISNSVKQTLNLHVLS